jgi:hypothetical protein
VVVVENAVNNSDEVDDGCRKPVAWWKEKMSGEPCAYCISDSSLHNAGLSLLEHTVTIHFTIPM